MFARIAGKFSSECFIIKGCSRDGSNIFEALLLSEVSSSDGTRSVLHSAADISLLRVQVLDCLLLSLVETLSCSGENEC